MTPLFEEDGSPANLEAAALDALEWLLLLQRWLENDSVRIQHYRENMGRLGRAIDALKQFIELDSENPIKAKEIV